VVAPTPRPVTATIADDENTTPMETMYRRVIRNDRRQHQHATGALLVSQLQPPNYGLNESREGATMQFIFFIAPTYAVRACPALFSLGHGQCIALRVLHHNFILFRVVQIRFG
jgi:hypothetical protein